jgi:glutaredoxin 3
MAGMSKVQIYTTGWCPYCLAAKSLLDDKGIAYDEIDASDNAVRMEMIQRSHGRRTVPQIFIDDRHIGGYNEIAALERGGQLDPYLS